MKSWNINGILLVLSIILFTTEAQRCQDRHENCQVWQLLGYCRNPIHAAAMSAMCTRSCNLCGIPGNPGRPGSSNSRFRSSCVDQFGNCADYKIAGYCVRHRSWMMRNCQWTCGLCPTKPPQAVCKDDNTYCSHWKKYCDRDSVYWAYMSRNCKKTCNLCTDGGTGGGGSGGSTGKKEYKCGFETDFCDWANQPIDDAANWAIGVAAGGPSSGANGSASYAYVDSTTSRYNAKLILPWELVLPADKTYIGSMCLHLSYQTGDGSLKIVEDIYPTSANKNPSQNVRATLQGSGTWVNGKVLVQVDDKRQLTIDGIVGSSGRVVIDNIAFVKGNC